MKNLEVSIASSDETHITIKWAKVGVGFGQFVIYPKDGICHIENEFMSKDFIKEIMNELVDQAILDDK